MVRVNEREDEAPKLQENDPSSISSEGSFVVLDPPDSHMQLSSHMSIPSQLPSLNSYTCPEIEAPVSLAESIPSDLSPEELHKKIEEVVQHNLHLKELLYQNNLSLKQNYQILVAWKEELSKQQRKNNEKFAEHKQFTVKLIAENKELKRCLEELKHGSGDDMLLGTENEALKTKVAELEQKLYMLTTKKENEMPSKKEQELNSLVEQITRQLENAERARRQLTIDNERLNAQKTRMEKEMNTLKEELEQQKARSLELEREYNKLLSSASKHIVSPEHPLTTTVAHNEKTDFASSMESYQKQLQEINNSLEEKTERYTGLDSWLQVAADNVDQWSGRPHADPGIINNLKKEIEELRSLLIREQNFGHGEKINLAEAQKQFQKLFSDYQELLEEWETFHEEQKTKRKQNNDYYEVQVRGFSEKIDNMTAQLMAKEEALEQKHKELVQKDKDLDQLNELIRKLKLENEEISILKAQVEVYQSDFNAEREARANLAGEKDHLAEELRHLQRRNTQLTQELEKCQKNRSATPQNGVNNGWSTIATPGRARANTRNQGPSNVEDAQRIYNEDVPPPREFICPKCSVSFKLLQQLEYHVETCLDLTD